MARNGHTNGEDESEANEKILEVVEVGLKELELVKQKRLNTRS